MAKDVLTYQPGPVFYDVWAGALRAMGMSIGEWCAAEGMSAHSVRLMATGALNGEKSHDVRRRMVAVVGDDVFRVLYEARERRRKAA